MAQNFLLISKSKLMKSIYALIAAFVVAAFSSSCITTKNHNKALSDKDAAWTKKYNQLEASYNDMKKDKELLETSSSRQLDLKEKELAKKEKELQDREKKVKELRGLIDSQRDALTSLKAEVCSALKCFTPEELQVEVRDGKLYVSMSDKLLFPSGSDK